MMVVQPRYDIITTCIYLIKWDTKHKCRESVKALTCRRLAISIFDFINDPAEHLLVNPVLFGLPVIQFLVQISNINNAHLMFHV